MDTMCIDERFELISKAKAELLEATNIESSPEEMAVIDNILFRFWQMGWLDRKRTYLDGYYKGCQDIEERFRKDLKQDRSVVIC